MKSTRWRRLAKPTVPDERAEASQSPEEQARRKRRRRTRRIVFAVFVLVICFTILQNTLQSVRATSPLPSNILVFTLFFNFNILLLIVLTLLVLRDWIRLYFERRSQALGSRFKTKLVVAFVGFSLIPSILLFLVAGGLITNSINRWFNTKVESSLSDAQEVVEIHYQVLADNAVFFAEQISEQPALARALVQRDHGALTSTLTALQRKYSLAALQVFDEEQRQLAVVVNPRIEDNILVRSPYRYIERSLAGRHTFRIKGVGEGITIWGFAPVRDAAAKGKPVGVVATTYYIPENLAAKVDRITDTFGEYSRLKLMQNPIQTSYMITFLMITLLIVFSATWLGFYLARGISIPIQKLAEGTRAIAAGNMDFQIRVQANDEIGILVDSFNRMTENLRESEHQLEQANEHLWRSNEELEQRRSYIETVLKNVAAGVISLDGEGRVTTVNRSAETLLGLLSHSLNGRFYGEAFGQEPYQPLRTLIERMSRNGQEVLEEQVRLAFPQHTLTVLTHVSIMKDDSNRDLGTVMVLDDLTELIKAQKIAAWQEMARGLAHEVKNPLTPIQLSAQRLKKKYREKAADFGTVFEDCVDTIISQVDGLRGLVDEFSRFARLPDAHPMPRDLHALIDEVIPLYQVSHRKIEIQRDYDPRIPAVELDDEQIKRALINLLENAMEAMEGRGRIWIRTRLSQDERSVRLEVSDEGQGISPEDRDKLFLPYFSTKKRGTGLGLAIVNRILGDHRGTVSIQDHRPQGTTFVITLPV